MEKVRHFGNERECIGCVTTAGKAVGIRAVNVYQRTMRKSVRENNAPKVFTLNQKREQTRCEQDLTVFAINSKAFHTSSLIPLGFLVKGLYTLDSVMGSRDIFKNT